MPKYTIDVKRLYADLDIRRRQNKLSLDRLAARLGIKSGTSLNIKHLERNPKVDIYASLFLTICKYLNKDPDEYLIENKLEVYDADSEK